MKLGRWKDYSGALNWRGKRRVRKGRTETRGRNTFGRALQDMGNSDVEDKRVLRL